MGASFVSVTGNKEEKGKGIGVTIDRECGKGFKGWGIKQTGRGDMKKYSANLKDWTQLLRQRTEVGGKSGKDH